MVIRSVTLSLLPRSVLSVCPLSSLAGAPGFFAHDDADAPGSPSGTVERWTLENVHAKVSRILEDLWNWPLSEGSVLRGTV